MAEYLSGGITFGGIGSGTDFNKIVDQLKTVEELPKKRLESWKSDWKIRYDAFSKVIDSMREAQTKLGAINNPSKFITKVATTTPKDSILSATADAKALDSNHTIKVSQMASNSIWAFNGSYTSKNSSVNSTGVEQTFSYSYKGKTRDIKVPPGTTLDSLVNLVNKDGNNPGVRMNLIQTGGGVSFQMMGKDTGTAAELTVHPNGLTGMSNAKNTWTSSIGDPSLPFNTTTDLKYTFVDKKDGTTKDYIIPSTGSLQDLVDQINADKPGAATITTDANGKSTLTLGDGMTVSGRGLNGKVATEYKFIHSNVSQGQTLDDTKPADEKITYSMKDATGTLRYVEMKAGDTMDDLVTKVNAELGADTLKWVDAGGGDWKLEQAPGFGELKGHGFETPPAKEIASETWTSELEPDRQLDTVSYTLVDKNGKKHVFDMAGTENLENLAAKINAHPDFGPDTAKIDGNATDGFTLSLINVRSATGEGLKGKITSSDSWSIQHAQNAKFKVDNWPNEIESASNTVKGVIEGVEFTILGEGTVQLNIKSDTASVEKNIQEYLDAVNSVIKTMQDLSKVEEIKEGEEGYDKNSQFAKAKGSALTGNYGTQLLNSRMKSLTSGMPPGFERITGADILSGDMVSSLAQIGIKTCTQEGDPNYGLFMIAPPSTNEEMQKLDKEHFDKALKDNIEDVVNLFAADNIAKTNSADFHYNSHISGMVKPGTYGVKYTVNPDGTMGDVFINGAKAQPGGDGKYTVGGEAGDAKSLSIQIDNLTPGDHTGKISIQQGKVGEMEQFIASELRYNKAEPDRNGSIMILRENYKGIMDNIDKKIEKEEERIMVWERRQRLEYSRLETLLGQYNQQMTSMQSQLAGLNSQ